MGLPEVYTARGHTVAYLSRIYAWYLYVTIHGWNLRYQTEIHVYITLYDFSVEWVLRILYMDTHGLTLYSHEANDPRAYSWRFITRVVWECLACKYKSFYKSGLYVVPKHPLAILDRIHHRIAISKCYRAPWAFFQGKELYRCIRRNILYVC